MGMKKWNKTGTLAEDGSSDVEALLAISGFKTRTSGYSHADDWVGSEMRLAFYHKRYTVN